MPPKLTERDTRQDSHRARRRHRETEARAHGWTATCVPLTTTLGALLASKADEALTDAAASLRDAWRATAGAREAL